MLYKIFEFLLKLSVRFYFKKHTVSGKENLPANKPVMFVANHPGAFMDPIVIGSSINQPLYYLARGESFKNKFSAWFFKKIHMIPIYRKEETPELAHKNKEIFGACINHFKKGKSILIFPEGTSKIEPRLRKVKTGAARIALSTEAESNFELGLCIVPIGINYSNPKNFRTNVHLNIGEPIEIANYKDLYSEDQFKCAKRLTNEIENAIKEEMFLIEEASNDELFDNIQNIYFRDLKNQISTDNWTHKDEIDLKNTVAKAIDFLQSNHEEKFVKTKENIKDYASIIKGLEKKYTWFHKSYFYSSNSTSILKLTLGLILGFPLFLVGSLVNYLPYWLVGFLTNKFSRRDDFTGGLRLVLGMFVFKIYYIIVFVLLGMNISFLAGLVVFIFPLLGIFALGWGRVLEQIKTKVGISKLSRQHPETLQSLSQLRSEIINDLEVARLLYNKVHHV